MKKISMMLVLSLIVSLFASITTMAEGGVRIDTKNGGSVFVSNVIDEKEFIDEGAGVGNIIFVSNQSVTITINGNDPQPSISYRPNAKLNGKSFSLGSEHEEFKVTDTTATLSKAGYYGVNVRFGSESSPDTVIEFVVQITGEGSDTAPTAPAPKQILIPIPMPPDINETIKEIEGSYPDKSKSEQEPEFNKVIDPVFIIEPKYKNVESFSEGLAAVEINGKWGFIDKTGKIILEPKYDINVRGYEYGLYIFNEGMSPVYLDGKYGFINNDGIEVVKPQYDAAFGFNEGLAPVVKDGKLGYIDKSGSVVIDFDYLYRKGITAKDNQFNSGLALVVNEIGKPVFIDKTGKVVIEVNYDRVRPFSEGLAYVVKNDKYGYIDTTGKEIIKPQYEEVTDFNDGFARFGENGKFGFIDMTGKRVIKAEWDFAFPFSNGVANVQKGSETYFINKEDKVLFAEKDLLVGNKNIKNVTFLNFSEGLLKVAYQGKSGFVDKSGKLVIEMNFGLAESFSEGLAAVKVNGYWGFIANPLPPEQQSPVETKPESTIAKPTASKVMVNGKAVAFEAYNIENNNYFKLRDLAAVVSGSEKQFEVGWDGAKNAINLESGEAYTTVGGELEVYAQPTSKTATPSSSKIYFEGKEIQLKAYTIGGNNYFKLRDMAKVFNIGITWDGTTNTVGIDTKIDYKDEE